MKKTTRNYLLSLPILLFVIILFYLCRHFMNANSSVVRTAADSETGSSSAQPPESQPEKITEFLRISELEQDLSATDFVPLSPEQIPTNPCAELSVPTYITKIDDTYFIVDCYRNQVIYHDNLTDPLYEWQVMTSDISMGHTIASDGLVYLIDDTENNRVLVFEKKDGIFYHTQTFHDIGNRPHYIIYDEDRATFYVWSSMNGEMYLMRHGKDDPRMYLTEIRTIDAVSETYVRSFTIQDDEIYFVSGIPGNASILVADLDTFEIKDTYPVPDSMAGMIQLTKIEDYYYITISTDINGSQDYATIIRTKNLRGLIDNEYEDVYENFIGGGTPYYISQFDNAYYLTEHRLPGHSIWRFSVENNEISFVEPVY